MGDPNKPQPCDPLLSDLFRQFDSDALHTGESIGGEKSQSKTQAGKWSMGEREREQCSHRLNYDSLSLCADLRSTCHLSVHSFAAALSLVSAVCLTFLVLCSLSFNMSKFKVTTDNQK